MSEAEQSTNDEVNQLELDDLPGNLTGLSKIVAKKVLNNSFSEEVKNSIISFGVENASKTVKKLIKSAAGNAVSGILKNFAMALTVITCIISVIVIIVTLISGGNIVIPITILAVLVVLIWICTILITNKIAHKVSEIIFKAIEGNRFIESSNEN